MMISAVGISVDATSAYMERMRLQDALDSATMAAALADVSTKKDRRKVGKKFFNSNSHIDCNENPKFAITDDKIVGSVSCDLDMTFAGVVGIQSMEIAVKSEVSFEQGGSASCLITLHPDRKESLRLNSNGEIIAPGCNIQVNSYDSEAIYLNSDSSITASKVCVVGDAYIDSSSSSNPEPVNCPIEEDPLKGLPEPANADAPCNYTDRKITNDKTIFPGVYCDKFEIDSAKVTFEPGIYVIRDGEFIVNSGGEVVGDNVMLFFTGGNDTRFNFNSDSHVNLSGLTDGIFKGLVIYQDRDIESNYSIWNSDSTSSLEGVIYHPNNGIQINSGGAVFSSSAWTAMITRRLELNSESILYLNSDYESGPVAVPDEFAFGSSGQGKVTARISY
ncbi:MAG: hypothetical protein HKN36_03065 [Hellea sp.]|nr:hypothetical protein [Hellea sp.]